MEQIKRVPYGMSDFVKVIEQNNYYVDKTMYLPMLEDEPNYLFFIRPRRFGKSIFLSMLHAYYDCRTKDKFQEWFGNLWIGSHPTSLQGKFQILHLDFLLFKFYTSGRGPLCNLYLHFTAREAGSQEGGGVCNLIVTLGGK